MLSTQEQYIIDQLHHNGITNSLEQAHFMAQVSHESAGFTKTQENLNYSADALIKIWPLKFTRDQANTYGRTANHAADQTMIANVAYANRMGNGNVASGDGSKFKGRGYIQLTGRANYQAFVNSLNDPSITIETVIPYLITKAGATMSAIWFWKNSKCSIPALIDDVKGVTKVINGGILGLEDRILLTNEYKSKLGIQ